MGATIRKTAIANELETFLDDNESDLSPNLWHELEIVAGNIDALTVDLEKERDELKDEVDALKAQIEELEGEAQ